MPQHAIYGVGEWKNAASEGDRRAAFGKCVGCGDQLASGSGTTSLAVSYKSATLRLTDAAAS